MDIGSWAGRETYPNKFRTFQVEVRKTPPTLTGGYNIHRGNFYDQNRFFHFHGKFDSDRLATDDHMYVSRSRQWKVEYGSDGTTIYHGSPRSNMYIRIYDKAAERGLENVHWIRVEMQMRDEIAFGFLSGLINKPIGDHFRGVLHNYLRYVVNPGTDENMSRWPMTDYWAELIAGIQRVSCWSAPGVEYNEFHLSNFVINQAGNALDCYLKIFGMDSLIQELGNRAVKMSPKYLRLLEKYHDLVLRSEGHSHGK